MFKMPSGSKRSRISDFIRTPKEARTPKAEGWDFLRDFTVSSSDFVRAWKMILKEDSRIFFEKSARGPFPKKMSSGFLVIVAPEGFVVFYFFVVVDWVEVSLVVHTEKGVFLVFYVVDKEDSVEVVDFVKEGASKRIFGLDSDRSSVFEESLYLDFCRARDKAVKRRDREATFVIGRWFAFGADNFGVDEGGEGVVFLVVEIVADDDDTLIVAELRSCHGRRKLVRVVFFPI